MNDLNWLINHRFQEAVRHEHQWDFGFDGSASVTAACLWRLLEKGRIRVTSGDDGHKFGLPAPVDCVLEVNRRLAGGLVTAVVLREGTLDLEIQFSTGHLLQIIPDSMGYESWSAHDSLRSYTATGGGDLAAFGSA